MEQLPATLTALCALAFVLGMLVADGINGAWVSRLIRRADRTAVARRGHSPRPGRSRSCNGRRAVRSPDLVPGGVGILVPPLI